MGDISVGQIVHSRAGRDKNKYFTLIDIFNDNYVLIADGDFKSINNPKKKKVKHLVLHDIKNQMFLEKYNSGQKISDSELKKSMIIMGLLLNKEV